jgi:hypothetical protein
MLSFRVKVDYKLAEAGLICSQPPATAVVLTPGIKDIPFILGILE